MDLPAALLFVQLQEFKHTRSRLRMRRQGSK